jgi:hypothetical protein
MDTYESEFIETRIAVFEQWLQRCPDKTLAEAMGQSFIAQCRMLTDAETPIVDCVNFLGCALSEAFGEGGYHLAEIGDASPLLHEFAKAAIESVLALKAMCAATEEWTQEQEEESIQRLHNFYENLEVDTDHFGSLILCETVAFILHRRFSASDVSEEEEERLSGKLALCSILFAARCGISGACRVMFELFAIGEDSLTRDETVRLH